MCKDSASPFLDRLARLAKNRVSTRGHCCHVGFSGPSFCDERFCHRAHTVNDLLRIEAAIAGEPLPVAPLEVVALPCEMAHARVADFQQAELGRPEGAGNKPVCRCKPARTPLSGP